MPNTQTVLYLLALLSIYAFAAALDQQAEKSDLRLLARGGVSHCMHASSRRDEPLPAEASASAAPSVC